MYIIMLGVPGAGKGTQAAKLAEKKKMVHIATGDLFRKAISDNSELSEEIKEYVEQGLLVPDEITIKMLLARIAEPDVTNGVVLDGFPRSIKQAKALDAALAKNDKKVDHVIYIKVTKEELVRRLSGRWICRNCQTPYNSAESLPEIKDRCDRCGGELYQRKDDQPETIKKRLEIYLEKTAPLIDYYKKKNKLIEVNGEGKIEEIQKRIAASLA